MQEIDLNEQLSYLLQQHGIQAGMEGAYIGTDLPGNVRFGASCNYQKLDHAVNSRLDVLTIIDDEAAILESFGDIGATIEDAIRRNMQNFSTSSLHPLLAALGCTDPHTNNQVTIEEWEIDGTVWQAYIGDIIRKMSAEVQAATDPAPFFFRSFEAGIKAQKLTSNLHWFRGFYMQVNDEITGREFLMDNVEVGESEIFMNQPVVPGVNYYSCRNFIILKRKI